MGLSDIPSDLKLSLLQSTASLFPGSFRAVTSLASVNRDFYNVYKAYKTTLLQAGVSRYCEVSRMHHPYGMLLLLREVQKRGTLTLTEEQMNDVLAKIADRDTYMREWTDSYISDIQLIEEIESVVWLVYNDTYQPLPSGREYESALYYCLMVRLLHEDWFNPEHPQTEQLKATMNRLFKNPALFMITINHLDETIWAQYLFDRLNCVLTRVWLELRKEPIDMGRSLWERMPTIWIMKVLFPGAFSWKEPGMEYQLFKEIVDKSTPQYRILEQSTIHAFRALYSELA